MALDDRTCWDDYKRVVALADEIHRWRSEGHCEDAYRFVSECSGDFVLMIADDEEPSDLLWDFAEHPPFQARFAFPVLPILGGKVWHGDVGAQERLVWRRGWKWIGRTLDDGSTTTFEGHSEGAPQVVIKDNPGAVIWHYYLEAPRTERMAKAARYAVIDHSDIDYHAKRQLWEDHPEYLGELPQQLKEHLPK